MVKLEVLQEQLGKKKSHLISEDTVDELNKLVDDPDYGEEFLDSYVSYFNVMEKSSQWTTPKYMNAMKFFTLLEMGSSAVDAYVKVFPGRLESRQARGEGKDNMGGEASRFNASALVNEIRKIATIPVQLIHRNLLHESILKSAELMNDPEVSPAVQQKAAETLIRELKPAEDTTVNLKVGATDETLAIQKQMVEQVQNVAINQRKLLESGMNLEEIQKLSLKREYVEVEDE